MELRPNQIVTHNTDLENAMNTALSEKWGELRGLKVVSIALGSVTLPDEDAEMIKQAQRTAIMRDPTMAAATLVGAQADAMKAAASNEAGAMTGFMGMGMAMNAGGGMNAQNLFAMGQQQQQAQQQAPATPAAPAADGWKCACGATVSGNFCPNCGGKKASATACGRCLEMQMRCHGYRKILSRVRLSQAGEFRGLDLYLRHGEQGEILPELRRKKARGCTALPLR